MLQSINFCLLDAGLILGILLNPEDGSDIFSTDCTALYPRI
jgi:hypothetical protein